MILLLNLFFLAPNLHAEAPDLNKQVEKTKEQLAEADLAERQLLANLFSVNQRMKDMSKRRDRLTDRRLVTDGDARVLAKSIAQLESRILAQKAGMRRRIRSLYILNGQTAVRSIFSAQGAVELDRNLRFLRKITDRDYSLLKDYDRSLKQLKRKRRELESQIRRLAKIQIDIDQQEKELAKEQEAKAGLLARIKDSRDRHLNALTKLRETQFEDGISEQDLDTAFFENKGRLRYPARGEVVKSYGVIQEDRYRFRLAHKGLFIRLINAEDVVSVFKGKVAFVGDLPGYGKTTVIDHGDHYYSVYGHLKKIAVTMGDNVAAAQKIGQGGGVSKWFGPGLYFEVRHFSDAIDPEPWLNLNEGVSNEKTSQAL